MLLAVIAAVLPSAAQSLTVWATDARGSFETPAGADGRLPGVDYVFSGRGFMDEAFCYLCVKNSSDAGGLVTFRATALNDYARDYVKLGFCYNSSCKQTNSGEFQIEPHGEFRGGAGVTAGSQFYMKAIYMGDYYVEGVADYSLQFNFGDDAPVTVYISYTFRNDDSGMVSVKWVTVGNGRLVVMSGGESLDYGDKVRIGTTLTVDALPDAGSRLESLTANGQPLDEGADYVVAGITELRAVFRDYYPVNWRAEGCTVEVRDAGGTLLECGGSVVSGSSVTIVARPFDGYDLESLTVNGDPFDNGGGYVVRSATEIVAIASGGTGLVEEAVPAMRYDTASQLLLTGCAGRLTVIDAGGRVVIDTDCDGCLDVSWLGEGLYVAVSGGKVLKFAR